MKNAKEDQKVLKGVYQSPKYRRFITCKKFSDNTYRYDLDYAKLGYTIWSFLLEQIDDSLIEYLDVPEKYMTIIRPYVKRLEDNTAIAFIPKTTRKNFLKAITTLTTLKVTTPEVSYSVKDVICNGLDLSEFQKKADRELLVDLRKRA